MHFKNFFKELNVEGGPFQKNFRQLSEDEEHMIMHIYRGFFSRVIRRGNSVTKRDELVNHILMIQREIDSIESDNLTSPFSILEKAVVNMEGAVCA